MESMTGFGEGESSSARLEFRVSARSVNHRFLDLVVRLPDDLKRHEQLVNALVKERLERGRVEVRIDTSPIGERQQQVRIRHKTLRAYLDAIEGAREEGLLSGSLTAAEMLSLPEVVEIRAEQSAIDDEDLEQLTSGVEAALHDLVSARRAEGDQLRSALEEILAALSQQVESLRDNRDRLQSELAVRFQERLQRLLGEVELDAERLTVEAALLAEKSEIQEELDRLAAHLESFRSLLSETRPVGKKMDFLCQEILRELNTIGSKCRETDAVEKVLEGKIACERLREQVQNIQ